MSCLLFSSFRRVVLLLEEVLQHRFQFIIECLGWGEAIGRIPLVIDNEGRKVPSNVLCSVYAWKLVLEKAVQLCLVSAPLTCPFVNQIELLVRSVLASKFKNLFVSSLLNTLSATSQQSTKETQGRFITYWFLASELIARESKDFESLRIVLVMKLDKLRIVCVGHASLRCNVDDTEDGTLVGVHLDVVALHITINELVEVTC